MYHAVQSDQWLTLRQSQYKFNMAKLNEKIKTTTRSDITTIGNHSHSLSPGWIWLCCNMLVNHTQLPQCVGQEWITARSSNVNQMVMVVWWSFPVLWVCTGLRCTVVLPLCWGSAMVAMRDASWMMAVQLYWIQDSIRRLKTMIYSQHLKIIQNITLSSI